MARLGLPLIILIRTYLLGITTEGRTNMEEMEIMIYEKPEVSEISIVADETISLSCWNTAPSGC